MSADSPLHLQHPGYPRAIGDILEHGTPDERASFIAWARCKLNMGALRELALSVDEPASQPITETEEMAHAAANR